MTEPAATLRPRYEALSNLVEVFSAPDAPELRKNPLQQLWREHMLSRSMVQQGLYDQGRFVVIYPAQNNNCDAAVNLYQSHLISGGPSVSGFDCLTLERSEEHTSELQSLMRISYAVFCWKKKTHKRH